MGAALSLRSTRESVLSALSMIERHCDTTLQTCVWMRIGMACLIVVWILMVMVLWVKIGSMGMMMMEMVLLMKIFLVLMVLIMMEIVQVIQMGMVSNADQEI